MRAVDTDVLVRLLVRDQVAQVKAAEVFIENGAWVCNCLSRFVDKLAQTLEISD